MIPEVGIYPGTPYHEYASWRAVRASTLNECFRSMAHGREAELNPKGDSKALAFGTAFHTAVLEPDRFRKEYAIIPDCDRRTKAGKEEWAAFTESLGGKIAITESDYEAANKMMLSVYGTPVAGQLLSCAGATEVSFVWQDEETGVLCKGRVDAVTVWSDWTYILDLKSTKDASQGAFYWQMRNFGYYRSLAWYRMGLNALSPFDRKCVLLAVEKTAPYCAVPYEIDRQAIELGEAEMRRMLKRYDECAESGNWPGYSDGQVPVSMDLRRVDYERIGDESSNGV